MLTWNTVADVPSGCKATIVTIGKFDGVHLGHQALLSATTDYAREHSLQSVCLTFDRHPDALFAPERLQPALTGPHQKAELIAAAGIDAMLVLTFDQALASLAPEEFVREILVEKLNVRHLVVGEGFRFGSGGAGSCALLTELAPKYGFTLEVVPPVLVDGERVSTSRIRALLDVGEVVAASALLGRLHRTTGMVEHGKKLGRELGFPTANLARSSEGFLPLDGVYAGWLTCSGVRYPAALSVGINETVEAVPRLLEAHVLDRTDLDFYDQVVDVEYFQFLRPAAKFSGLPELIEAITDDCNRIRAILRAVN